MYVVIMMQLKDKLRQMRKERGLTQEEAASLINISRGTLAKYEVGMRDPDIYTLSLLADLYNTSTDYLLGRTKRKKPYPYK